MKNLILLTFAFILSACSGLGNKAESLSKVDPFEGMRGCFLLYNVKTQQFEKQIGSACLESFPACSTFKVPLAVMAFDSGVLKNEKQILKWDGKKRMLEGWNKDHNATSWMPQSVVWFSQRLTPKIGEKKLKKYLQIFKYGNEDVSTGITSAWLNSPADPKGALAINAYEQVEFMRKLWMNELPASKRAMELTRQITSLESSPNGFKLHGKTGSNFYDADRKVQFGWFVTHVSNGEKEYIAVTNISDIKPVETDMFGGFRAKELTKNLLKESGLW